VAGFKDYIKDRLDRRYSRIDQINALQKEIAGLDQRFADANEFDRMRREIAALKTRFQQETSLPGSLPPTAPGDHSIRLDVFRAVLEPMKPGHMVDLATGHGRFARIAQELGWQVTAVDARTERMPMTEGIQWVESDLRDFDVEGFDLVAMLGIFYHLELNDQLELLKRCAGTTTILDTHVALEVEVVEGGYEGILFTERSDIPTASWINPTSFWPTENALIRMLHDCGYRFVFRLTPPPMTLDRTWYLCY
jgi:SAM-dependent methyltransferase